MQPCTACTVLIASLLAAACTSQAHAAVVIHDNRDGTFQWTRTLYFGDGNPQFGTYLDIRQSPQQSGTQTTGAFLNYFRFGFTGSSPGIFSIDSKDGGQVAWNEDFKSYTWNGENISTIPANEFAAGDLVTSSYHWESIGQHYLALPFSVSMDGGTPLIERLAYLGVRIKNANNTYNYGWVLFEDWSKPLMWAYETTPNTPIQIPVPAPSAAGLVLLGTAWTCRRRRA